MNPANLHEGMGRACDLVLNTIDNPGASGTFVIDKTPAYVTVTDTGNYTLPDKEKGWILTVVPDDTSVITLKNSAGTTVGVFTGTSGATGMKCESLGLAKWTTVQIDASSGVASITAAEVSIADANSLTGSTTVETVTQELLQKTKIRASTTYNNTDATGTLAAAAIVGGIITRTGETANYVDTTDTAAAIIAALPAANVDTGYSQLLIIKNTVAFTQTLAGGSGVTLTPTSPVIPGNHYGLFNLVYNAADEIAILHLGNYPQTSLPTIKSATSAAASPVTVAAGILEGSMICAWQNTTNGAVQVNTRTAAQIIAAIPNAHVGFTWEVVIGSRGDNTVTLTAGDGNVTVTNGAVATGTVRRFVATIATATTVTMFGL